MKILKITALTMLLVVTSAHAENVTSYKYFVELGGSVTNNNKIELDPSLKLGGFFYKYLYAYVQSTWQDRDAFTYRNMDYKVGMGWQQQIKSVIPFVEINYTQHGTTFGKDWKKNLGYDFGIKDVIKGKYAPFIRIDDLFNNDRSDSQAGLQYKINDALSASVDYTVYKHNVDKHADISITYSF